MRSHLYSTSRVHPAPTPAPHGQQGDARNVYPKISNDHVRSRRTFVRLFRTKDTSWTSTSYTAMDIIFSSASVVNGDDDAQPYLADVLVSEGITIKIGPPGSITSSDARTIDAAGCWLTPGFIDMHAHSDLYLLTNPTHEAKITQGCTVRNPSIVTLAPSLLACYRCADQLRPKSWDKMASPITPFTPRSRCAPSESR